MQWLNLRGIGGLKTGKDQDDSDTIFERSVPPPRIRRVLIFPANSKASNPRGGPFGAMNRPADSFSVPVSPCDVMETALPGLSIVKAGRLTPCRQFAPIGRTRF